ncbi:hypothetical protein [Cutibacterium sp.]|uniref:hypothetical protein n=1 Tax=Cutibacterium sp. TaxID=1912221 RepID=UPI0026DAC360|nr:hypothetical protein [Cutibacterium sp.]MDO4412954.1 hypothetical protein [Cutibacterium sp.]
MAFSRPMPIRMAAVAVAGFLGIAGLSGCAGSPNTAATVGNKTVSMESVDEAADHCSKYINPNAGLPPRQVISSTMIRGAVAQEILDNRGEKLSDAQRDQIIARNGMTALTSDPVCNAMARDFAGIYHLFDLEGEQKTMADLAAVEVKANPRLGTWDAKNLALQGSSSLSEPFTSRP